MTQRLRFVRLPRPVMLAAALTGLLAGCGGGPAPPASPPTAPPTAGAASKPPAPSAGTAATPSADPNDPKSKTKWIGNIPYDVFYDQPLLVAAEATSLGPLAVTPNPATSAADMPPAAVQEPQPPPDSTAAAGDGPDWKQLIDASVLNDAVTKLSNALTTNLNTLANYNQNTEAIANDGACLAALAAVAEVHPDAVTWKANAKYVRDLGYQVYTKSDGNGRGPYDATREPFEQIVTILSGGPPPDMEADDKVPMADVADRSELMKRIKKSFDYLRTDINTESRFKELSEDIIRESSVMGTFGGMVSTESYDSADEEKYRQFVRDFMQANMDVAAAVKTGSYPNFEAARSRIQKACNDCHGEYAFGNEGF